MPARRVLALSVVIALLAAGCGLLAPRPAVKLNPAYRGPAAARLQPIRFAPVIGCPSSRRGIEPAHGARRLATGILVPDLLDSLGSPEHPGFAPRGSQRELCDEFFTVGRDPSWAGGPVLRRAAEAALDGTDAASALFLMLSMQYRCERVFEDILARDGVTVIGRLDRGQRCYEDGVILVIAALVTRAGELAWISGGPSDDGSLREFSRDWPGAVPEPPATHAAR